jgi:small neutral amino acid transporter SnatA (MarC family)
MKTAEQKIKRNIIGNWVCNILIIAFLVVEWVLYFIGESNLANTVFASGMSLFALGISFIATSISYRALIRVREH